MKKSIILLFFTVASLYEPTTLSAKLYQYSSSAIWNTVSESEAFNVFQNCVRNDATNNPPEELNCILAQMKQSGASQESMNFVTQLAQQDDDIGWLEKFDEKGRVDLGFVTFPVRANTNGAYFLLNGTPSLVSTELNQNTDVDISHDPNYLKLKNQYPNLQLWLASADFKSMQSNSDGGQSFIFVYPLVNGCHACEVEGTAEIVFKFDRDGIFKGTSLLRLNGNKANSTPKTPTIKSKTNIKPVIGCNKHFRANTPNLGDTQETLNKLNAAREGCVQ